MVIDSQLSDAEFVKLKIKQAMDFFRLGSRKEGKKMKRANLSEIKDT